MTVEELLKKLSKMPPDAQVPGIDEIEYIAEHDYVFIRDYWDFEQ